jgi:hypothetical protein
MKLARCIWERWDSSWGGHSLYILEAPNFVLKRSFFFKCYEIMIYFKYILKMNYGYPICVILNFKFILFKSYNFFFFFFFFCMPFEIKWK